MLSCWSRPAQHLCSEWSRRPIGPHGGKGGFHSLLSGVSGGGAGCKLARCCGVVFVPG